MNAGRFGHLVSEAPISAASNVNGFSRPDFGLSREDLAAELSARADARFADRLDAHQHRRAGAMAGLSALDTLPAIHTRAAWRLVARTVPGASAPEALRRAVDVHTIHHPSDVLAAAEAAAHVLASLTPPETEADADGVLLCRGDEGEIAKLAIDYAASGATVREIYDAGQAARPVALPDPEPWIREERACPRWWKRRLRRSSKRAQIWYDTALRLARADTSPHVSVFTLAAYRQRQHAAKQWAETQAVQFEDGTTVPLAEIQARGRKARKAATYAVLKGMEHHGETEDYTAFFLTLTLPPEYHAVIKGQKAPDGSYPSAYPNPRWTPDHGPAAAWEALSEVWGSLRARLAKVPELRHWFGISVPEPHHDGTPHIHALVWLKPYVTTSRRGQPDRRRGTALILRDILRDVAPGPHQARLEIVRKRADRVRPDGSVRRFLSPASYVAKYALKSIDDEETLAAQGDAGERHRAWASSRGIRRMRTVGAHGSMRIWQRIWTSSDDEELPERASAARAAMRRSAAAGERATAAAPDTAERIAARAEQAAAAAAALVLLGALPGATGKLKLGYDDAVTAYGRPTRKAARIDEYERVEDEDERGRARRSWIATGKTFALRRQFAELITVPTRAASDRTQAAETDPVTVAASYPRGGATPHPPELRAVIVSLEALIRERDGLPGWSEWCAGRRRRLDQLKGTPPPGNRRPLMTKISVDSVAA